MTESPRRVRELTEVEIRILGALLEKEQTTPEYYPLTVNALIAACNQKSNREPVTALTETEIVETLDELSHDVLAWRTDGARSERWSQSISRRLELDPEEKAILTLLMLRGSQTAGELRSRSHRLHEFESLREIDAALERMADAARDLVVELERGPGQKENRWAHLLTGTAPSVVAEAAVAAAAPRAAGGPGLSDRVAELEASVAGTAEALADIVHRLQALEDFRSSLED